jgi:hypothetical protein
MTTPSYEQILSFGSTRTQLVEAATAELQDFLYPGITQEELNAIATAIGEKYSLLGSELGAQWYDLCTQLAGIESDPAELSPITGNELTARVNAINTEPGVIESAFKSYLQNVINDSIRRTGDANLWRDYERGLAGGKWCRVPVGETCAWCLMLASNGAWYKSEETALGTSPDHYHSDCNCVAVNHADAESIKGYGKLSEYKQMHYEADDTRRANKDGKESYPEDLAYRIAIAKAEHAAREEAKAEKAKEEGKFYQPIKWTNYNEDLIVMRYKYGLK